LSDEFRITIKVERGLNERLRRSRKATSEGGRRGGLPLTKALRAPLEIPAATRKMLGKNRRGVLLDASARYNGCDRSKKKAA